MKFAIVDGTALHYAWYSPGETFEPRDRPVLVFINSLGTDFRIWDAVRHRLAGSHGMLFYDKRGHGLSDVVAAPYAIDDHVRDLAGLMDVQGIRKAIVIGLSVGGMIAMGLAAARPDLIGALVLSNTAPKIGEPETWAARIEAVRRGGVAAVADDVLRRWFTSTFRDPANALYRGCRNMLLSSPSEGYAGTCAAIAATDYREDLSCIDVPTLCIAGEADGATPPDLVKAMANGIAGARFTMIEEAGHIPNVERPDAYVDALESFLETQVRSWP